ncbi:MAG TPA: hypothetical protein VFR17_06255 [Mycobacterium sp.]|nr:hypothetical protein [Mycobacterium sp.]
MNASIHFARLSFAKATAAYGDPASVLSDNGAVFTGRYRGMGRVALEVTLHSRGISFRHSRPYHPQTSEWDADTPAHTFCC